MLEIFHALLDKALYMAFFMSVLFAFRFTFFFVRETIKEDLKPMKYTPTQLLWLALTLGYILMSIFNGIKL